jgi:hypothetical protein
MWPARRAGTTTLCQSRLYPPQSGTKNLATSSFRPGFVIKVNDRSDGVNKGVGKEGGKGVGKEGGKGGGEGGRGGEVRHREREEQTSCNGGGASAGKNQQLVINQQS